MHNSIQQCSTNHISWTGIFAGALVANGLFVLFHLLSIGLGLSSLTQFSDGNEVLAFGAFIWVFLGSYIIMFLSGWTAGYFIRDYSSLVFKGILQGFLAWIVALLIAALVLIPLSQSTAQMMSSPLTNVTVKSVVLSISQNNNPTPMPITKAAHRFGVGTLATFLIFLSGALGGAIGGFHSIKYKKVMVETAINRNEP